MQHPLRRWLFSSLVFIILFVGPGTGLQAAAHPARSPAAQEGAAPVTPAPLPLDQPLRFERFSLEDGLSQNTVFTLLQDRQGFLWAGTQDGLNRYDGYGFTAFKRDPDDPNSLSLSSVLALYEDRDGMLWIGTWGGGLNRYDPHTGLFYPYRSNPDDPGSLSSDIVTAISEDTEGQLWVGTCGGGLDRLDPQSGKFTHFTSRADDSSSLSSDNISTLFLDKAGQLWVGTGCLGNEGAGLNRFDPRTGQAVRYLPDPDDPAALSSANITAIVSGPDGALWLGSGGYTLKGNGLNRLDPATGQVTRYQHDADQPASLSSNDIMSLLLDSSGVLWIATWGGGLDRLPLSGGLPAGPDALFYHQNHNPFNAHSLSSDVVWSLYQDRSGVIWAGTANGGLNKLNPQVQRFGLYRNNPGDPASLAYDAVGPLLEDRHGRIWIGTLGGGLELFDRQAGAFQHFPRPADDPNSQQANTYLKIYEDRQGTLWFGSLGGLTRFTPPDPGTPLGDLWSSEWVTDFRHNPSDPSSLGNDNVGDIIEDPQGRLWIGSLGSGLDVFDRQTETFTHVQVEELGPVFRMYVDRSGLLWVGSWGFGLYRIDPSTYAGGQVQYTRFLPDPKNKDSLSDSSVFTILEDAGGMLWFGAQNGLDRYDPTSGTFTHYQEKDGLANNTVLCTLLDAQGKIWISTNGGISQFDPQTGAFRNFDVHDGLQSNEFDSGACMVSRAGEMYFGGQHGLSVFRPDQIQDNLVPPPVALTAFRLFNEPVYTDLAGLSPIQLSYQQNFIAFEFVALDFHAPEKNRYQYRLEGFDRDWVDAGGRRYAGYTNLGGGSYTFRVRAANNNGVWNEAGLALPVTITPPFWDTWWFRAGLVLGVVALSVLAVQLRLASIRDSNRRLEAEVSQRTAELRQANQRLEQEIEQRQRAEEALAKQAADTAVVNERNRLARDLHDAVTQTLFSASLLSEVIPELWEKNEAEARRRLEELRQLTRGALAEMRTLLLELRPAALTNASLPELLRQLSEATIGRARLPIELVVDGSCSLAPEIQVALYRIAQEALNNVVKYAKASQVMLSLKMEPGMVRLMVVDDGIGFEPDKVPPNHLGLRIMRERAEGIGARLSIYSEPGEGTQVTVVWEG